MKCLINTTFGRQASQELMVAKDHKYNKLAQTSLKNINRAVQWYLRLDSIIYTLFLYKNLFYKNVEAEI